METKTSLTKLQTSPDVHPPREPLTIYETILSGTIMGFIAYNGSFSVVPISFTSTALIFGPRSLITIYVTSISLLAAGYLHTHASRTGMSISTDIFHGFYIAKAENKNRCQADETRWNSLKRFFRTGLLNALVLNLMWDTFTIFYLLQTYFMSTILDHWSVAKDFQPQLILVHGITRYFAGCLSGISTGVINHLWQRHQSHGDDPHAIFNTDKVKLKLQSTERRKLLSPTNLENWIKVGSMSLGALFVLLCNIPNLTELHLLPLRTKKFTSDILVIHGGWFFFRDAAMLVFKKREGRDKTSKKPLMADEAKNADDQSMQPLKNNVDV